VAAGLNSKPKLPEYDMSKFDGFSFHALEMAKRYRELTADGVNHVTIIGGHKSALEAVGTAAQAGKNVEWLLREEGGGPTWMMAARTADGSSTVKMGLRRFMKLFSTSVYHSDRWIDRFFHGGRWRLGTWFISWFWNFITSQILQDRYIKSENGRKLRPIPPTYVHFAFLTKFCAKASRRMY
jgi:dimethylaniline monooxygenase (N-oxide forming)